MPKTERLHIWFLSAMASFTLSVGMFGLHPTSKAVVSVANIFLILGSVVVLTGVVVEVLFPLCVWVFGARGRCVRAIQERMKEGRRLLRKVALSKEDFGKWQDESEAVLARHLGGQWHHKFLEFEEGKAVHLNPDQDMPKIKLAQQLERLGSTLEYVRAPESLVMFNRSIPNPKS